MNALKNRINGMLDRAELELRESSGRHGLNALVDDLYELKQTVGVEPFAADVVPVCRAHRLVHLLHQEPITRHAWHRPRGYPGDAELLDLYYRVQAPADNDTDLGHQLYQSITARSAAVSVRWRLFCLAHIIDEAVAAGGSVLSVGCGHFREGAYSLAVRNRTYTGFVCMDHDPRCVATIARNHRGITARVGSVRHIVTGKAGFSGSFDLVYATGLFDYLDQRLAKRLTTCLFQLLSPGGKLLIGNFLTHTREQGYMEAFMNWPLVYRSEGELQSLASEIDVTRVLDQRRFNDPECNVSYLLLQSS